VIGGASQGAAIIDQKPDKIFFTGSVATGKKIMAAASQHLTPVCLELGGKDAMIVLPDADLLRHAQEMAEEERVLTENGRQFITRFELSPIGNGLLQYHPTLAC
jgi:acyl-CoA reductase-like NAD-dependent aldehyde dehydrogenase